SFFDSQNPLKNRRPYDPEILRNALLEKETAVKKCTTPAGLSGRAALRAISFGDGCGRLDRSYLECLLLECG
ncbi:MAG: hypothetical protein K2I37_07840, partial [Muribaculaceae bacterium]|nr:hypothetical protein [Muribaculaceae bacterium]